MQIIILKVNECCGTVGSAVIEAYFALLSMVARHSVCSFCMLSNLSMSYYYIAGTESPRRHVRYGRKAIPGEFTPPLGMCVKGFLISSKKQLFPFKT